MLCRDLDITLGTMSKLDKGKEITLSVHQRIFEYWDCDIADICEVIHANKAVDKRRRKTWQTQKLAETRLLIRH